MMSQTSKTIEVKYAGRYTLHGVLKYTHKETDKTRAQRVINEMFRELGRKYRPDWIAVI